MSKTDFKKEFKEFYSAKKDKVSFVDVPKMKYLSIEGKGDPNTSKEYRDAIEALMSVSFKTKFIMKKEFNKDYVVMPLEGLWYADNMDDYLTGNKSNWKWNSLVMQPDFVDEEHIKMAIDEVQQKKDLNSIDVLNFIKLNEGLSAQIMHIGPFKDEGPTVSKLHNEIENNDYSFNGLHHEIYLSDIRRANPEKLKTIIRQPIKKE
ncbi:GyrI-like domain-containing protein [Methanobrevibacter sp. DSM 116169]|uniref:GyrI-like domain-containing protein n=1 Tax=Methanobrevibacter sp. DSM 116169 TaxID=3242727 RepID=UPI0038FC3DA6